MTTRRPPAVLSWPGFIPVVAAIVLAEEAFLDALLSVTPALATLGPVIFFASELMLEIVVAVAFAYLLQFFAEKRKPR